MRFTFTFSYECIPLYVQPNTFQLFQIAKPRAFLLLCPKATNISERDTTFIECNLAHAECSCCTAITYKSTLWYRQCLRTCLACCSHIGAPSLRSRATIHQGVIRLIASPRGNLITHSNSTTSPLGPSRATDIHDSNHR